MQKIFRPSPKSFKNTFCVFQLPLSSLEALTLSMQVSRAVVIITLKGDVSGIKSLGRLATVNGD
jgi:hypothetical protein